MAASLRSGDESEVIFTINRNVDRITVNNSSDEPSIDAPDANEANNDDGNVNIVCMVWRNGKLGAAYYNFFSKLLYFYEEMVDVGPEFMVSRILFREINPKVVLTFGNRNDQYVNFLSDFLDDQFDQSNTSDKVRNLPLNLYLLTKKDYHFDNCRTVLSNIHLLSENAETTSDEKEFHLNTLINFDYKESVYAIGALVKYLDKNWVHFTNNREELQYLDIEQVSIRDHLILDSTTFNALQIFHQCSHEASFKRGLQSSTREGLSIYRLFSANCKSKIGQTALRNMLRNPTNNMLELDERLDFIAFILHPAHHEFVESLLDNIKSLVDINKILLKIENLRAHAKDWYILYKVIYHTVFIYELSAPYINSCAVLQNFHDSVTMDLRGVENSMNSALDFTNTKSFGRPVVKFGLDESLDAKKMRRDDISMHVTAAAAVAIKDLPDFISECSIVYLPEMGHLIAIKEWQAGCDPEQLQELGYELMFILRDIFHYKNPMCLQLDQNLGDINGEIIAHENRILQRLSSFLIKYNRDIRKPLHILAQMDALMAMGKVAAQNGYVRPQLNTENLIKIERGRHLLLELVSHFEPNDYASGQNYPHIKVITGPNGSGKSVFLKQIALIVYLAHIGSYVPAQNANIGMMYSIYSRIQATESASVRLSAFMIDVMQATQALHNARANSLILLDEFGRGTIEDEGFALLVGTLKRFFRQGATECPHVIVSTHFQKVSNFLPGDHIVQHLKMEHTKENDLLLYLYRIVEGVSGSFAFEIANEVNLDRDIIERARVLLSQNFDSIQPLASSSGYNFSVAPDVDFLSMVDVPEPDPE